MTNQNATPEPDPIEPDHLWGEPTRYPWTFDEGEFWIGFANSCFGLLVFFLVLILGVLAIGVVGLFLEFLLG